ncbi:MAG: P1 family peptidase [Bacteroidales bacterium]|nr:P1 family peptidase [Bacteroidales bacterium]
MKRYFILLFALLSMVPVYSRGRLRDYSICPGIFKPGENNAITDVNGVKVGHVTLVSGDDIRTGVTAIIPHEGNIFQQKCPAALFVGNGFGKFAGATQINELGNIETPVVLTNTLSVAEGIKGLVTYTLNQRGNEKVRSVNAVVGETNDGKLNAIRKRVVTEEHVLQALANAKSGPVEEGCVGAGTGTVCFGFKGGIGTSSRVLPNSLGGYTVGVLVQTNYGGILEIDGVQVGRKLGKYSFRESVEKEEELSPDGSCMIIVITDAPLDSRNLERLAKRAFMGLAKTGSIASNGSGDYILAISVNKDNLIDSRTSYYFPTLLHNDSMSPLFEAAIEATEEALWNSLFAATTMSGNGITVEALPVEQVVKMLKK